MTKSIVYAEVVKAVPGEPIGPVPPRPDEATLPTTDVTLRTLDVLRGEMPDVFRIVHVSGPGLRINGDPEFRPLDRYILFLTPAPGEPGVYDRVAIDGRLYEHDGVFDAPFTDLAAGQLRGHTRAQIRRMVNG